MTIKELKKERDRLIRIQQKEYTTRGNTQTCQELWEKIMKIEDQIAEAMQNDMIMRRI